MHERAAPRFVILNDQPDGTFLFLREDGLPFDWQVTPFETSARVFATRDRAYEVLRGSGKNKDGWRILQWT